MNRVDAVVLVAGLALLLGGIALLSVPWALIIAGVILIAAVVYDDGTTT